MSRLYLVLSAVLFSTAGVGIKAIGLTSGQVASFRAAIAAVAVGLMIAIPRRAWTWRVAPVAAAYAVTVILFVHANKLTTAANSIFLQSTSPLYILLLSPWMLGERPRARDLVYMAALAVGVACFLAALPPASVTAPDPRRGNLMAAACGVTSAFMMIGLRWLGRAAPGTERGAAPAAVVLGNLMAFVAMLPAALPVSSSRPIDWLILVFLGVVQIGLAYALLLAGLRDVPVLEASLLAFVEPALAPVWAWLVHGERPGEWAVAGGLVILAATAVRSWLEAREASSYRRDAERAQSARR